MNEFIKKLVVSVLILGLGGSSVYAQEDFQAIPKQLSGKYRFDFARNFFPSPEAETAERKKALAYIDELEKLKGRSTASADNLYRALELFDKVQAGIYRHASYLYLRYAVNTKDEASLNEASLLWAEVAKRTSFLQQEMMALDDAAAARLVRQKPELKAYSFVIESARRYAPHTLSLKEEELLSELTPLMKDWTVELFQKTRDRTQFGTVLAGGRELDVYKQDLDIENSPDRAVRESGFKKRYAGFASQRDLYAFTLSRLVKSANQIARARHYKDAADSSHFGGFLTSTEVKDLFEKIAAAAEINKRYERAQAANIKRLTGYEDVNVWDLSVVPAGLKKPRFTIDDTTRILKESLSALGDEYSKELSALLDPANGRLDIVGGDNRVPGAFAQGNLGDPVSTFYSFNYLGYFDDVDALAHEAGHAVHFQLIGNNHVRPSYSFGPGYFTESFAMFNELLVIDHLYRNENDRLRKIYFLEQFLTYALYFYRNTMTAAMEQAIYDAMGPGQFLNADELDALTKRTGSRFSIWYDKNDELKMRWIATHHFYDNQLYYWNYVYAALLALKYYEMYEKDPKGFLPNYLALMRNGFDAPPADLLKRFLNLDLRDPRLVADAAGILSGRIDELEALYAK